MVQTERTYPRPSGQGLVKEALNTKMRRADTTGQELKWPLVSTDSSLHSLTLALVMVSEMLRRVQGHFFRLRHHPFQVFLLETKKSKDSSSLLYSTHTMDQPKVHYLGLHLHACQKFTPYFSKKLLSLPTPPPEEGLSKFLHPTLLSSHLELHLRHSSSP